ncbi:hypothetical protein [Subtercola boreus]|nr:hypothetical protein [Subtercola boreus]
MLQWLAGGERPRTLFATVGGAVVALPIGVALESAARAGIRT